MGTFRSKRSVSVGLSPYDSVFWKMNDANRASHGSPNMQPGPRPCRCSATRHLLSPAQGYEYNGCIVTRGVALLAKKAGIQSAPCNRE